MTMPRAVPVVLIGLAMITLGSQRATSQDESREPSVQLPPDLARVLRAYEAAWGGRNAVALAKLFAEDGYVLPNGGAPVKGRANIERHYTASGGLLFLRALAFAAEGRVGYIIGAYGSSPDDDIGKFTLTLRKADDGRWLIVSDMDSSNRRR